jgi:hypothetical protein
MTMRWLLKIPETKRHVCHALFGARNHSHVEYQILIEVKVLAGKVVSWTPGMNRWASSLGRCLFTDAQPGSHLVLPTWSGSDLESGVDASADIPNVHL